jgi:hypothetical protein
MIILNLNGISINIYVKLIHIFMASKYIDISVIVEPRKHDKLKIVIQNILENLKDVKVQIFHGNLNKEFILSELSEDIDNIILTNLNKDNLTVREYSNMLLTKNFYNLIKGERILLFQTDSCICNYNEEILKECQKYGYVGAPTKRYREIPWQNGGFSFRKKSLMIKAVSKIKQGEKFFPEDRFFSVDMKTITNPAKFEVANRFSVENYYNENPFGQHKCWRYQNEINLKKLIKKFNIIDKLRN